MPKFFLSMVMILALALPNLQSGCWYDPAVEARLAKVQFADWSGWVRALSGDVPVQVGGETRRITTRFSPYLFDGTSPAYDFVLEQISAWYPADQIEEDEFGAQGEKNLILTIPGSERPDEIVVLTAHLDSRSNTADHLDAPGADDNASGSAALLEAARVLRPQSGQESGLPRTLRIIWFTAEEQGMIGSYNYAADHSLDGIVGVINVDMIGYDGDGDRCFELHVGVLPESQPVGQCFANAIAIYAIDLRYEFLTTTATTRSDHSAFWNHEVGALSVSENFFTSYEPESCGARDANPNYHGPGDTYANMHPQYAFDVSRAAIAAAFSLASPQPAPFVQYFPLFQMLKID